MAMHMPSERAALAQVAGVQRTHAELDTLALLASMDDTQAQIAKHSKEERQEMSWEALAAVNAPPHVEARRAAVWAAAMPAARKVALMSANLNSDRHADALRTFNALERGLVWVALGKLTAQCNAIRSAMTGGDMPSRAGASHELNGITSIGEDY